MSNKIILPINFLDVSLLFVFYAVAHCGIFSISNAIYWDDWTLYRASPRDLYDVFAQTGSMFNVVARMHIFLLSIGPWLYRSLTFFLMFFSGVLFALVLQRHSIINRELRFFLVLLFLVLPLNAARVALIDFVYVFCYFLFFLAWVLQEKFRLLALILFFLSFNTNSLLVFYALPMLDMMYRSGSLGGYKSIIMFWVRRLDYLILPFVYFWLKLFLYNPSGVYAGYNEQYSVGNLVASPILQIADVFRLNLNAGLILLSIAFVYFILVRIKFFETASPDISSTLIKVGALSFIFGAFPYWILGHVPVFVGWSSRHQLLLPFGLSLLIIGFWLRLGRSLVVMYVMVGCFLAVNVANYRDFYFDWEKQKQLIKLFSSSPEISRAKFIVFDDRTVELNAMKRKYRFYEWSGLLEAAFGNELRFGIGRADIASFLASQDKDKSYFLNYKAKDFVYLEGVPILQVDVLLLRSSSLVGRVISEIYPKYILRLSPADASSVAM